MANLVELVKQAALEAVAAAHPAQAVFGKVTDTEPLAVRIHQKLRLTAEFLALSETVRTKLAAKSLRPGDTLLLLQQQGGQRFLALDVLPGADWTPPAAAPVTWADVAGKPAAFPPAPHAHTAAEVGAAPAAHTHTPAEIGAAPQAHAHTAAEIGAAPASHTHTAAETGAAPAAHTHAASDIAAGMLPLARGGTGAASAAAARTNLGITYSNLGTVPVANGGTSATDARGARTNLAVPTSMYDNVSSPDQLLESGFYRVDTQAGVPHGYGQIIVAHGGHGISDTIAQVSIPYNSWEGNPKIRFGNPPSIGGKGSWYEWYDILTSIQPVSIAQGGTGATSASGALSNLGAMPLSYGQSVALWTGVCNRGSSITIPNANKYGALIVYCTPGSGESEVITCIYRARGYKFQIASNQAYCLLSATDSGDNKVFTVDSGSSSGATLNGVYGLSRFKA